MSNAYVSFYSHVDVVGTFELLYNPKTKRFKEVKEFEDSDYGRSEREFSSYEMNESQQEFFNEAFPYEE